MKRIVTFAILIASTYTAFSQSFDYNDLGVLFSKDDNYGTARFEAMSGAFGALGGDISSIGINPAGGVINKKSFFSATLSNRNTEYSTNYYGNNSIIENDFINITQAGGSLVFDSAYNSSGWDRFALSFNYRLKTDFDGLYSVNGNSNRLYFTENPNETDPKGVYDGSIDQTFYKDTNGQSSVMSFGFSAVHQKKLFVGGSINFHNIEFHQKNTLLETNDDVDGNILDARNIQESFYDANGFSLGLGFIYKLSQNIRFGLAYETPTWYPEIIEDTNVLNQNPNYLDYFGYLEIETDEAVYHNLKNSKYPEIFQLDNYKFKSPTRITASGAFIFGKQGLISVDYTYKGYKNIKFNGAGFSDVNQFFSTQYRNTHTLNVGTEWRFDKMSIRGGYHYEKNPNLLTSLGGSTNLDNLKGFSLGLGYNFGNTKFDLGYRKSESIDYHTLYNIGDITINNNTARITGTLTFNL
jgi:hypothetical protein